ncbi:hypothetical protein [Lysobacter gummosus]|uniref:hypothetical protein n=1 Tax=Lysobacter gummosus TaxID=262324 RepID=UPI003643F41C
MSQQTQRDINAQDAVAGLEQWLSRAAGSATQIEQHAVVQAMPTQAGPKCLVTHSGQVPILQAAAIIRVDDRRIWVDLRQSIPVGSLIPISPAHADFQRSTCWRKSPRRFRLREKPAAPGSR